MSTPAKNTCQKEGRSDDMCDEYFAPELVDTATDLHFGLPVIAQHNTDAAHNAGAGSKREEDRSANCCAVDHLAHPRVYRRIMRATRRYPDKAGASRCRRLRAAHRYGQPYLRLSRGVARSASPQCCATHFFGSDEPKRQSSKCLILKWWAL